MTKKIKIFGIPVLTIEDTDDDKPVLSTDDLKGLSSLMYTAAIKFSGFYKKSGERTVSFLQNDDELMSELKNDVDVVVVFIFLLLTSGDQAQDISYSIGKRMQEFADSIIDFSTAYQEHLINEREALINLDRITLGIKRLCEELFNNGENIGNAQDLENLKILIKDDEFSALILGALDFWKEDVA